MIYKMLKYISNENLIAMFINFIQTIGGSIMCGRSNSDVRVLFLALGATAVVASGNY